MSVCVQGNVLKLSKLEKILGKYGFELEDELAESNDADLVINIYDAGNYSNTILSCRVGDSLEADRDPVVEEIELVYEHSTDVEYFKQIAKLKQVLEKQKIPFEQDGNPENVVKYALKYAQELCSAAELIKP